jgi:hypothetical protein
MRIAILCPGPSLSHFDGPDDYAEIIGVNRAATAFRCSIWACGDYPLWLQAREAVIGTPLLFTAAASASWLRDNLYLKADAPLVEFESLYDGDEHTLQWPLFTATAALWYAAAKGARLIRTFGADWAGTGDWDHVQAGNNRTEDRWKLEAATWGRIVNVLAGRGVTVERVKK